MFTVINHVKKFFDNEKNNILSFAVDSNIL
ncbi:hypothetical protein AEQU3_00086 [Aequorivita antarctica]|nr:hypothetical protein AEQU3_00086 [Aequorivita antarctica]